MPETQPGGYVSVDLAAKVAGISWNDMQQLAVGFAKGRTEPWLGAVLDVRTEKVLGRKLREIRVATLPIVMREALAGDAYRFLLAAEQGELGAALGPPDFLLLHRAVHSGVCPEPVLRSMLAAFEAGGSLLAASREDFDCAVSWRKRHRAKRNGSNHLPGRQLWSWVVSVAAAFGAERLTTQRRQRLRSPACVFIRRSNTLGPALAACGAIPPSNSSAASLAGFSLGIGG